MSSLTALMHGLALSPMRLIAIAINIAVTITAVSTPASAQTPAEIDSASIAGVQLDVVDNNGVCVLQYHVKGVLRNLPLTPKPPCFFLRNKDGTVQHFGYPDVGVKATLIVAGTLISSERRKMFNLTPDLTCGDENQGVLITKNNITASKFVSRGGVVCQQGGTDEKDFWFFAHPKFYKK